MKADSPRSAGLQRPRLVRRYAKRFADKWVARYPDMPMDDVALTRRVFQEVYDRARLWRSLEPDPSAPKHKVVLARILDQVETELEVARRERPALVFDLLLDDLQATVWRPARHKRDNTPADADSMSTADLIRRDLPLPSPT